MELLDYLNRRRDRVNQHYQWLTSYRKKIESSPKIEHVLLLCDNLTNELMVLNNEVNYRLETALKIQDEKINKLVIKIEEMYGSQAELDAIKEKQKKLLEFQQSLENAAIAKAEQLDSEIQKNEEDLKKRLPGVE